MIRGTAGNRVAVNTNQLATSAVANNRLPNMAVITVSLFVPAATPTRFESRRSIFP
jgi:hypothetical protein